MLLELLPKHQLAGFINICYALSDSVIQALQAICPPASEACAYSKWDCVHTLG